MRRIPPTLLLFLLAFGLRAGVSAARGLDRPPRGDERGYLALSESLRSGRGYSFEVTKAVGGEMVTRRFTALRPPLWPLALTAATGPLGVPGGRLFAALCGALTVVVLLRFGRMLLPERAALAAACLLAVWPAHVYLSGELLAEPLGILLLTLGGALLQSGRSFSGGGALGLAVLARPGNLAYLPFAVAHALWSDRTAGRRLRALLLLLAPALLLPGLWAARNARLHGRPLLTTNLGVTFLGGNCDAALDARWPGGWRRPEEALPDAPPQMGFHGWLGLTEAESDRRFLRAGLDWIRSHPARFLRLVGYKALRFIDPDPHSEKRDRRLKTWLGWTSFGFGLPLFAAGMILALRRWRRWLLAIGMALAPFALALVFYGDARARLPAVPALLLLAVLALGAPFRPRGASDARRGRPSA